ncbi:MAG: hypothetical protein Q4A29_07755 [Eubacteriales bacterium]|nr:hypothetical protein [Eubacteriales bacterium]
MRSKDTTTEKILEFYNGFKESTEEVQKAMYRTAIESLLWMLGNKNLSYLEQIMNAGGRETDEPFITYMDAFERAGNLEVFCVDYDKIKQML